MSRKVTPILLMPPDEFAHVMLYNESRLSLSLLIHGPPTQCLPVAVVNIGLLILFVLLHFYFVLAGGKNVYVPSANVGARPMAIFELLDYIVNEVCWVHITIGFTMFK